MGLRGVGGMALPPPPPSVGGTVRGGLAPMFLHYCGATRRVWWAAAFLVGGRCEVGRGQIRPGWSSARPDPARFLPFTHGNATRRCGPPCRLAARAGFFFFFGLTVVAGEDVTRCYLCRFLVAELHFYVLIELYF